ncbi:MAG: EF-hand domain-containing protein [Syntrophobacterales bacterium]|nr:EF-hand domain-containing protein [Syntrophobacterales bacterium]
MGLGLLALFSLALPAAALTPTPEQVRRAEERRFMELDRNRDGRVSRQEYLGFFNAVSGTRRQYFEFEFRKYDRNRDGYLTREELKGPVRPEEEFRAMDADGDGRLSPKEFLFGGRAFSRMDLNRDNFLSLPEYLQGYRNRRP